ncbi:MAG: hypothetical protein KKE24_08890 [Candidatus Thermoplasmatota archaeon]|nr:hypothetical protein [Candidatus Thermoplasmatota archaeon]
MNSTTAMALIGLVVTNPYADAVGVSIWCLAAGITLTVVMAYGFFVSSLLHIEDASLWKIEIKEL